ncbi:dirigent protein 22-like [Rutidosis leptorrhynchoides]|uniref:dirigent protein 22-like n=1 Tax=Rutidosis leptorrhynchoides TaxID=125765 RepID=UPI003A99C21C
MSIKTFSTVVLLTIFVISSSTLVASVDIELYDSFCEISPPLDLHQKLTHLRMYRRVYALNDPEFVNIARPLTPINSTTLFGYLYCGEIPMTATLDPNSTKVAITEGLFAFVSKEEIRDAEFQTTIFTQGKFNGSTLSNLGDTGTSEVVRERPIVGGTRMFRGARGYATARNVNGTGGLTGIQYDLCFVHYV